MKRGFAFRLPINVARNRYAFCLLKMHIIQSIIMSNEFGSGMNYRGPFQGTLVHVLTKSTRNLIQSGRCLHRYSKLAPTEYMSDVHT